MFDQYLDSNADQDETAYHFHLFLKEMAGLVADQNAEKR
jgi:hypothetical protein